MLPPLLVELRASGGPQPRRRVMAVVRASVVGLFVADAQCEPEAQRGDSEADDRAEGLFPAEAGVRQPQGERIGEDRDECQEHTDDQDGKRPCTQLLTHLVGQLQFQSSLRPDTSPNGNSAVYTSCRKARPRAAFRPDS